MSQSRVGRVKGGVNVGLDPCREKTEEKAAMGEKRERRHGEMQKVNEKRNKEGSKR